MGTTTETGAPTITAEPVKGLGYFTWKKGPWERIFDRQIDAIKRDLAKAHAEDRMVVYLSCPISPRGGGHSGTNVEVANFTARRLMDHWGERLFVLNPAAYQMESREGTGMILEHVRALYPNVDPLGFLDELRAEYEPKGGDYMRMWVRVLAEDGERPDASAPEESSTLGGMFDAYYFLGPTDMAGFFGLGSKATKTAEIEAYFARKYSTDPRFREDFDYTVDEPGSRRLLDLTKLTDAMLWENRRKKFFRYYAVRAGAAYSLGSRDEWNTLVRLNRKRQRAAGYLAGEEIACFFDGRQVDPAAATRFVPKGYEVAKPR